MEKQIKIKAGSITALATLFNTKNAEAIWQALPFKSTVHIWGDEIYFRIPLKIELEAGQEIVEFGDLGYWPPGSAFCIFFGLTPMSNQDEIRAASAVDIFGRLEDDPALFRNVEDGEEIVVERA
ncbi:cyclophilin-like fold protein [Chloroflexota bacterium]